MGFCRNKREPRLVTGVLHAMDFRLYLPRGAEHILGLLTKDQMDEVKTALRDLLGL